MNEDLIDILIKMGAENVEFKESDGNDDSLAFQFRDKYIEISGIWHNDGTGGIVSDVSDV